MDYIRKQLLQGFCCRVFPENGEAVDLKPVAGNGEWTAADRGVQLRIGIRQEGDSALFSVDLVSDSPLAPRALTFGLDLTDADAVLDSHHMGPWWMYCGWPEKSSDLKAKTQNLLLRRGDRHTSVVMLTGDIFRCEADGEGLHLESGCAGYRELHGTFLAVTSGEDPFRAMEENYRFARACGAIRVPLREERTYPAILEKFGWCTWDAFYKEVTAEKIYEKLTEFRDKGVPVHWIIIDAGWSAFRERLLVDFPADPVKFPEGLAGCIKRCKEEFGIEQVGIWHTFNAYWDGIAPDSPLLVRFGDVLMRTETGLYVPHDDPEKAFRFWDAWHGYLADCGVDFVKVDNQSSTHNYLAGTVSTTAGARRAHEAIERSIEKHFGGVVINCMGMDMENVLARPASGVARNSDDFYPQVENGFAKHIQQNLYGALWHSRLYHCDFDMWWSGKASPVQSGVLRAISGGPVYVSDKIGETAPEGILPVVGKDGNICRLDQAAMPTADCLYVNCETSGRLMKAWNRCGDAFALAVFNISGREITETVSFEIPGMEGWYVKYDYFTKTFAPVRGKDAALEATRTTVTLQPGEVVCWSIYPILGTGEGRYNLMADTRDYPGKYILLGDTERYVGIGTPEKEKVWLKDIL